MTPDQFPTPQVNSHGPSPFTLYPTAQVNGSYDGSAIIAAPRISFCGVGLLAITSPGAAHRGVRVVNTRKRPLLLSSSVARDHSHVAQVGCLAATAGVIVSGSDDGKVHAWALRPALREWWSHSQG